jgi:hypothetical protein
MSRTLSPQATRPVLYRHLHPATKTAKVLAAYINKAAVSAIAPCKGPRHRVKPGKFRLRPVLQGADGPCIFKRANSPGSPLFTRGKSRVKDCKDADTNRYRSTVRRPFAHMIAQSEAPQNQRK